MSSFSPELIARTHLPIQINYPSTLAFGARISGTLQDLTRDAQQIGTLSKCQKIVRGLLIGLVLSAAILLFAKSGGPANLAFTIPGGLCGVLALGLIIGCVVRAVRAHKMQALELHDLHAAPISQEAVLQAMEVKNTDIHGALREFDDAERRSFMTWVYSHYLGAENTTPLLPEQIRVLSAFNGFVKKEDLPVLGPHSLFKMLNIENFWIWSPDSSLRTHLVSQALQLPAKQFGNFIANHPLALSMLIQTTPSNSWQADYVVSIYMQMTNAEKTAFLDCMHYNPERFSPQDAQEVLIYGFFQIGPGKGRKEKIEQIITACAQVTIPGITDVQPYIYQVRVLPGSTAVEEHIVLPHEITALATAMAKWPQMNNLLTPFVRQLLGYYAEHPILACRLEIMQICSLCPEILAEIHNKTPRDAVYERRNHSLTRLISSIVQTMNTENQVKFRTLR